MLVRPPAGNKNAISVKLSILALFCCFSYCIDNPWKSQHYFILALLWPPGFCRFTAVQSPKTQSPSPWQVSSSREDLWTVKLFNLEEGSPRPHHHLEIEREELMNRTSSSWIWRNDQHHDELVSEGMMARVRLNCSHDKNNLSQEGGKLYRPS